MTHKKKKQSTGSYNGAQKDRHENGTPTSSNKKYQNGKMDKVKVQSNSVNNKPKPKKGWLEDLLGF